ncbi:Ig-like domain-containing protein [Cohnella thailandensis]|uniref:Ig-like domain-containing protein n=1 Tax=Cohnella thailandensis TaxID=557557 RepID=A0A841T1K3_9BACL|nr:Ig-like domain-containing protein [Cohnella thailandensis]MBB6635747.1 Ig-like domain-containing protein [Cohnella thailandensis]MBP1976125.1 uncharacterized protein YjdB [Cohnella thailandensis]
MKRISTIMIWTLAILLMLPSGFGAKAAFADSSEAPPVIDGWVQVSTAEQLLYIDRNQELYLSENIRLANDIDLSGNEWVPLGGNGLAAYSGTFDGRGHVVSGIEVTSDTLEVAGFFGQSSGIIRNLGVEVEIDGGIRAGGITGSQSAGRIEHSYSLGSVSGRAPVNLYYSSAGGLAGESTNAVVTESYSEASVSVSPSANQYAGGLVGSGNGSIRDSYARGPISNQPVTGIGYDLRNGGLTSFLINGSIERTYATGRVDTSNDAGAFFAYYGGLMTDLSGSAAVVSSYFDTQTTEQASGIAPRQNSSGIVGLTTAKMKDSSSYVGWDFDGTWAISPAVNDGYPYLRPVILTTILTDGVKDEAYPPLRLEAWDGARGGIAWSASGLPDGMTMDASGLLRGTPAESGTFVVEVAGTDAGGAVASEALRLTVAERAPDTADIDIGPGAAFGTTRVTAEPADSAHTFAYTLGDAAAERPLAGSPLPADAVDYTPGDDIAGASAGQYLTVYEVDASSRIQAWGVIQLFDAHFQTKISVTGVSLDKAELTLTVGDPAERLIATVAPADATNKAVAWSSNNANVAIVDPTGEVTAVGEGMATIVVTTQDGGFYASAVVTVLPALPVIVPVTGVSLDKAELTLTVGDPAERLIATVAPADATNKAVAWSSSNANVAIVDPTGKVTAVGEGTATIVVTTQDGGFYASAVVTVLPASPVIVPVTGVALDKTELTLTVGDPAERLIATVAPADATNQAVAWSSSDADVATVSATGEVTAVDEGTATITATTQDGGFYASAVVTVLPAPPVIVPVTGVTLDKAELTLTVGDPAQRLTATVAPADATNKAVTWSSSDANVVTVSATGEVTAVDEGTATITVTTQDGGFYANAVVTVLPAPPVIVPVTGVTLDKAELTLTVGDPAQRLTATIAPADATNQAVTWNSSDTDVATVTPTGEVTAIGEGTATITITTQDGGFEASAVVTVLPTPQVPTVGSIAGTVYGTGGEPLNGATVTVGEHTAATDDQGSFTLENIEPGSQTITITASGYQAKEITATVLPGDTVDVGRIDLIAETTTIPGTPVPIPDPIFKMTVKINGHDIDLTVVKERTSDGRAVTRLIAEASQLQALFDANRIVEVDVGDSDPVVKLDLPANAIKEILNAQPDAAIRLKANGASFSLPLAVWRNIDGSSVITIAIGMETETSGQRWRTELGEQGLALLSTPTDFSIYIDGREMTSFGNVYTERTITLDQEVNPALSTVVWLDADRVPHFVPSVFQSADNATQATFYAPHNSLYAVVQSGHSFDDVQGHWAQKDIELLANKLIVNGTGRGTFAPNERVTRASFAAMLVRALGLTEASGVSLLSDIRPYDWFAGAVATAYDAGLILGDETGAFRPNDPVTREQMAAMIARAIAFAGLTPETSRSALDRLSDKQELAVWANEPIAILLQTGVMEGNAQGTFAPRAPATRAECAAVLSRLLQYLQWMN